MRRMTVAVALVLLAACSAGGGAPRRAEGPPVTPVPAGPPPVYVAVGASETVGIGAEVPLREAWPRVLYRTAMPENTVFYNMGIPGATVADALARELPKTLPLQPTVVTVWLNANDLIAGVSPADYERNLGDLVHQLRRGGATRVLVANTPPLDHLPSYRACRPDPPPAAPPCRSPRPLPGPEVVNQLVDEYNGAVRRVSDREGANLVDLHAVGLQARSDGIEDALVSADGFHPNTGGYQLVANAFAEVLRRTGPLG